MGRVSKHKKIKAMDPFYKGPRREPSKEDNLPPAGDPDDDQPVPKSLLRIVHSGKSHKKAHPHQKADPHNSKEASASAKDESVVPKSDDKFVRRKGESLNDFLDRIDIESRERMVDLAKKSRGTSERRKKYFEKRRKRLESKKGRKQDSEDVLEFKDLKDDVRFGEVASAPPIFSAKPKGKKVSKTALATGEAPHLSDKREEKPVIGLKRKQDLEDERDRLIQEYRMTKKAKSDRTTRQLTL